MDSGLSWADQWDTAPDPPPPNESEKKKDDEKSGKKKLAGFFAKVFGKKSHNK